MIGIHIANTLPETLVDIPAATTMVETIQLHKMTRTNNENIPVAANSA
jgi:hypothetical protein